MTFKYIYSLLLLNVSLYLPASEPTFRILSIEGAGDDKHKVLTLSASNNSDEKFVLILHQGQIAYDPSDYQTQELVINCVDESFLNQQHIKFDVGPSDNPNLKKWYIPINKQSKIQIKLECYCFEPGYDLSSKNINFKFLPGQLLSKEELTNNNNCLMTQKEYHNEAVHNNLIKESNRVVFEYTEPILKSYTKEKFAEMYEKAIIKGLNNQFASLNKKTLGCAFFRDWNNGYSERVLNNYFDKDYRFIPKKLSICIGQAQCVESDIILNDFVYLFHDRVEEGYQIKFSADISFLKEEVARKLQKK